MSDIVDDRLQETESTEKFFFKQNKTENSHVKKHFSFYRKRLIRQLVVINLQNVSNRQYPYNTNCYRKLSERFQNHFNFSHFIYNNSKKFCNMSYKVLQQKNI